MFEKEYDDPPGSVDESEQLVMREKRSFKDIFSYAQLKEFMQVPKVGKSQRSDDTLKEIEEEHHAINKSFHSTRKDHDDYDHQEIQALRDKVYDMEN